MWMFTWDIWIFPLRIFPRPADICTSYTLWIKNRWAIPVCSRLSVCKLWYWTCKVSWFIPFDAFLCRDYSDYLLLWNGSTLIGFLTKGEGDWERVVINSGTRECNLSGFCTVGAQSGFKRRFLVKILLSKARQRVKDLVLHHQASPTTFWMKCCKLRGMVSAPVDVQFLLKTVYCWWYISEFLVVIQMGQWCFNKPTGDRRTRQWMVGSKRMGWVCCRWWWQWRGIHEFARVGNVTCRGRIFGSRNKASSASTSPPS